MTDLAAALQQSFDGRPWHGGSLMHFVERVAPERAFVRPAPEVRSIAELLGHTTAWLEIVTERLRGENPPVPPERDFPSVDGVAWETLVAQLHAAFAALLAAVNETSDWERQVPGRSHTMQAMVEGVLHHVIYHTAQIALLERVLAA